jgi:hypothetical protein
LPGWPAAKEPTTFADGTIVTVDGDAATAIVHP